MVEFEGSPRHLVGKSAYACFGAGPVIALAIILIGLVSSDLTNVGMATVIKELTAAAILVIAVGFVLAMMCVVPILWVLRRFGYAGPTSVLFASVIPSLTLIDRHNLRASLVAVGFGLLFAWFFNRRTINDGS